MAPGAETRHCKVGKKKRGRKSHHQKAGGGKRGVRKSSENGLSGDEGEGPGKSGLVWKSGRSDGEAKKGDTNLEGEGGLGKKRVRLSRAPFVRRGHTQTKKTKERAALQTTL